MARTYKTIAGLTYQNLDTVLVDLGYKRHESRNAVACKYPENEKALLLFPVKPLDSEVRGINLVAARSVVDGFGIADASDFDVLLIRFTAAPLPILTH